jgi:hypothetical protein
MNLETCAPASEVILQHKIIFREQSKFSIKLSVLTISAAKTLSIPWFGYVQKWDTEVN